MNWETETVSAALEVAIVAQLALFSAFAFVNARAGATALYFLAALAGLITLMLAGNFLSAIGPGFGIINTVNIALELLVGPALYLYVQQALPESKPLERRNALHTIPAFLGIFIRFSMIAWLDAYVVTVLIVYLAASGFLLWRGNYPLPFVRFGAALISLFSVALGLRAFIATDAVVSTGFRLSSGYPILLGAILIAACLILFVSLQWPEIINAISRTPKYARSSLGEGEIEKLALRLREMIDSEQPHLQTDISLDDLAQRLDVAPRYLSQAINSTFGMNFSAFLNIERVKVAAKKLGATKTLPIKSIMYDSGFRSKTAFNQEFKKVFGITPSEYRGAIAQRDEC